MNITNFILSQGNRSFPVRAAPIQNAVSFSYENIFGILKSSQQIWVKSDAKDVNRLDSIQAKSFGGMRKL